MKTLFILTLCAALFSFGGAAYAQVNQSEPQLLIKSATQQIVDEVRSRAIKPDDIPHIMDIVNRGIVAHTDFRRTTSLAMGRYWRTATPAEQQQMVEQSKMLLIHTYSGAVGQLRPDQQIDYAPIHIAPTDTDMVVRDESYGAGQQESRHHKLRGRSQGCKGHSRTYGELQPVPPEKIAHPRSDCIRVGRKIEREMPGIHHVYFRVRQIPPIGGCFSG
jgi:phospholipid transport system substrate-binding protein